MEKSIYPLISVIVPVYNVEKYLKRCLDSIIRQTYCNIEILLIDDGSADASGKICDTYAEQYQNIVVVHKENGGLSSARNEGIKIAKGEYLGFVDSDDWISLDMYETLYDLIKNGYDVACVGYEEVSNINSREKNIYKKYKQEVYKNDEILEYMFKNEDYSVCNKLYRNKLLTSDTFSEGIVNEDILANYYIFHRIDSVVCSQKICYKYYKNPKSITNGYFKERDFDLLKVCQIIIDDLSKKGNESLVQLVEIKLYRSYFSLLAKIAYYGIDSQLDKALIVSDLLTKLRKNYIHLLFSYIPLNRKMIITLFCINYHFIVRIFDVLRGKNCEKR